MNETDTGEKKYKNSRLIMASYGSRELFGQWITAAFGFTVFFFYVQVIGMPSELALLAFVLYSVWNAFNDPLVGYIMERIYMPWEKKWGIRRFPWMIIGVIPWLISFALIFMVPLDWYTVGGLRNPALVIQNQWLIFFWYLGTLCLYDTLLTIYDVNVISLFPDKFTGLNERRTVQGFGTILGIFGLVLAAIIPPNLVNDTYPATYGTMGWVSSIVGIFIFLLVIPGVWETKRIKDLNAQRRRMHEGQEMERFFKSAKIALSNRRFMMKTLFFWGYQIGAVMLQTSGFYITTFILDEDPSVFTYLLGAMLIGALISTPLWTYFSKKVNNNKKISVYAGFTLFVTFIPLIFLGKNTIGWAISLLFFGFGVGGHWFIDPPTMGDVLDDITVKTGKRQQSIYYGYQAFFVRFGGSVIAMTIALTHILTGYIEGGSIGVQPDLALFGIVIHSAIVPAIIVLITVLIFWKYYDLTPDVVAANKEKLKELDL
jgi:GPH family glycoside/pentoside/hexuronide:cation symporter